jgi:LuxR family transcriptional regulator of spore coat protein
MAWMEVGGQPGLTHRELQVLELVAGGYSAKQIASQIGIAPRTVEGHIENVRLKMRARNKTHMVTQALQSGVLKLGIASA